jgi:hypothetical protein
LADITITLPDRQIDQLRQLSERYGLSTEKLVQLGVEDMLTGLDSDLSSHVDRILEKNQALYERLAK